jgi:Major intrinsic protein
VAAQFGFGDALQSGEFHAQHSRGVLERGQIGLGRRVRGVDKRDDAEDARPRVGQHQPGPAVVERLTGDLQLADELLPLFGLANGPKLNGPFVPLAVGAYILAWGTMGGPYEGASINPARSFGPDVAIGNLSTWWVYLIGPAAGAVIAVGVAYVLRGPAKVSEASAA